MPPASAFRHPVSQAGTGALQNRIGSPYSGTGLVPASTFLFIPLYQTDRMPDSPTFRHLKKGVILHVHTAGCGNGYTLHVHRQLMMVLFLKYFIEKSYVNAGMPEKS
jgi:hypothetical protein